MGWQGTGLNREVHAAGVAESAGIQRRFIGWAVDQVDVSSDGVMVVRYRSESGELGWLSYTGALGTTTRVSELKANHRLLSRIENEKWRDAQMERTARIAARRDQVIPAASAAAALADAARQYDPGGHDDCSPHGLERPKVAS